MGETVVRFSKRDVVGPERHVIPTRACAEAWDLCLSGPYIVL